MIRPPWNKMGVGRHYAALAACLRGRERRGWIDFTTRGRKGDAMATVESLEVV